MAKKTVKKTMHLRSRDDNYYRYMNLCDMWGHYSELISRSDRENKEALSRDAINQSAEYLRSAIDIEESALIEKEKNSSVLQIADLPIKPRK